MGNFRHCHHVGNDLLKWLVPRYGLASSGRTMVHWWSKSERGTIVSIWNTAHNIGGMMPGAMVLLASAVFFSTHGIEAQAKTFGNNPSTIRVLRQ